MPKIYDKKPVITGLVIFVLLITFPFWWNLGKAAPAPELQKAAKGKTCVEDKEFMRQEHMQLLNTWRDDVVRNKMRLYKATDGQVYNLSLTNGCLDCHKSRANFCDKCHNYTTVSPTCWSCHVTPDEKG